MGIFKLSCKGKNALDPRNPTEASTINGIAICNLRAVRRILVHTRRKRGRLGIGSWWQMYNNCCVHLGSFGRIICLFLFPPFWSLFKQRKLYVEETQHLETFLVVSVRNHFSYSMILIRLVGDNKVSKWHWCVLMLQLLKFQCKKKKPRKRICSSVTSEGVTLCWTDCF